MATPVSVRPGAPAGDRRAAARDGVRIEQLTVVWMALEALLAVGAGVVAHSLVLTAFGLDSVIELVTGGILLWRLATEARGGALDRIERAEHRAAWVTGIGLILLCLYILGSASAGLLLHNSPEGSPLGIGVAVVALIGMPLLAGRKRTIAARLGSAALRGDAACSLTCAYLAATLLVGLVLTATFDWWWADSVAALGFLYWLLREAREALGGARAGRGGCSCGDGGCGEG